MGFFDFIKKEKIDKVREECLNFYGTDFIKKYDALAKGETIGSYEETIDFLKKVEIVRKRLKR